MTSSCLCSCLLNWHSIMKNYENSCFIHTEGRPSSVHSRKAFSGRWCQCDLPSSLGSPGWPSVQVWKAPVYCWEALSSSGPWGALLRETQTPLGWKWELKEQTWKQSVLCLLYSSWPTRISSERRSLYSAQLILCVGWFPEQTVN